MNIEFIGQSVEYVGGYGGDETIESAARTCTQTEVGGDSEGFVKRLVERGHMSPTEFGWADFQIECDRAIQQELTRHRHFTYNIESTRLINYVKKALRYVTKPPDGMDVPDECVECLEEYCALGARLYESWSNAGVPRDYLRKFFTLALASKVRMAGNSRAWAEMIAKRVVKAAHPEIREIANAVAEELGTRFKGLFGSLNAIANRPVGEKTVSSERPKGHRFRVKASDLLNHHRGTPDERVSD